MKPAGAIIAALFIVAAIAILSKISGRPSLAETAASIALQAMERGYQCHAAGRALDDCKAEQRRRWADPDIYRDKPFGAEQ